MVGKPVKVFYADYVDMSDLPKNNLFWSLHPNYEPLKPGTYRIRASDILGNDHLGNPQRLGHTHLTGEYGHLLLASRPEHAFKPRFLT